MEQELDIVVSPDTPIKVSVIIPIYNAREYVGLAIESAIDQTLREIEIICVDDGSTDHSLQVIKQYADQDPRIRIVTENNAGVAIARNNGLRRARGEYIAFLDADDFMESPTLERLYALAKEKNLDIAISGYDLFQEKTCKFVKSIPSPHEEIFADGKVASKNEYPDHIFQATDGNAWNKLFRRGFIEEKELHFLTDVKMFEDVYFVCTALSLAERIARDDTVWIHHRVHSESARNRFFRKYYQEVPLVYAKIKEFLVNHGMYLPLVQSFVWLSTSRIFKIYNILNNDSKESLFNLLHDTYAEAFGWREITTEQLPDHEVGEFIVNVAMYTYKQYTKREKKGVRVKLQNLPKLLKQFKTRERFKGFFSKMFGKKKKQE